MNAELYESASSNSMSYEPNSTSRTLRAELYEPNSRTCTKLNFCSMANSSPISPISFADSPIAVTYCRMGIKLCPVFKQFCRLASGYQKKVYLSTQFSP